MPVNARRAKRERGFTLIEVIASMVVTALAFTALANFFFNQAPRAIEPIFQTRAAKLGEALVDEILGRPFDENTPVGGVPACGDSGPQACTDRLLMGLDGESSRDLFDDVDDYDSYCNDTTPFDIEDALGNETADPGNALEDFGRFKMSICVGYDGSYDGTLNEPGNLERKAKLIIVKVFPPGVSGTTGTAITFKVYKGNF
ncbi:prepilin-type N-terminal cleavage/methylation domain-containing protein [Dasania marina]|uniref:type IV pilus modification PilV family protein n=1 Tax=Dasania marina TaxID=471499 RepID=UPI0030DD4EBD|tara:strand:- start:56693 stop:57295 length:603 start_codon:yes stop_codon:yes gene_type:complete